MKAEEQPNVTPTEQVEALQTSVQPSEQNMQDKDDFIQEAEGQDVVAYLKPPIKRRSAAISPGVLSIMRTGVVDISKLTFTTGVDVKKITEHNWTLRKVKLMFAINKYLPTYKAEVQALRDGMDSITLSDIENGKGTFLNEITRTDPILLRELSLEADSVNGNRTEYMDQTLREIKEIGHIETTVWMNAVINDSNVVLESTGDMLHVEAVKVEVKDAKGNIKKDGNGNPLRRRAVRFTYNNLWLYAPVFTQVPENFNNLLDAYGNDTPVFLPLLLHFMEQRGKKTEGKHIKDVQQRKVAKMKETKTRGDKWSNYISNGTDRQTSQLYRQTKLSEIIGEENMKRYVVTKTIKNKKISEPDYTYDNWFDADKFYKHLTRSLQAYVNMQVLTKARAFVIPKQQAKRDALVAELCKEFPGYAKEIKTLTPSDGVCCLVTYNGTWTKDDKLPFTPVREAKKPRWMHGRRKKDELANVSE